MNARLANWVAGVVLPIALASGCVLDGVASARTVALASGPVELWRRTEWGVERHLAAPAEGEGVPFGYKVRYDLGERAVVCVGRFARYRCRGGWQVTPLGL